MIREHLADTLPYDAYHSLYVKGNDKFLFHMHQKIKVKRSGHYQFSLSFMGDNTTGVKVEMYIAAGGMDTELEIGLTMDSPISYGAIKDIGLYFI